MCVKNNDKLSVLRRSLTLVLAKSLKELYGEISYGVGEVTDSGFCYDFNIGKNIEESELGGINEKMVEVIGRKLPFERTTVSIDDAKAMFSEQSYQLQLCEQIQKSGNNEVQLISLDGVYAIYDGGYYLENTYRIKANAFKLVRSSGAYWLGDAENDMLQRITGVAFEKAMELLEYEKKMEEISKRDHRVLGKDLDLYSLSKDIGLGLPLFHPKGAIIRYLLQNFSQQALMMNGYQWVYTPHIGRGQLWETSGHLQFYKDSMYRPIDVDGEDYYLKPMSCPFHVAVYKSSPKSYRDLPVRLAEYAQVYRYELSGALQGLTRVRGFTQDDAHIICTKEQLHKEVVNCLKMSLYILNAFGLNNFKAYIATKPPKKSIGEQEQWDKAIAELIEAVKECGLEYQIDEGGGAFYGPKIDLKINDVLGREWQCSTIQFDFNLPERFNITYVGSDGKEHTPYMVHRALFGSIERFFALLIEHYAGVFPFWLAPTQIGIVTVINEQHGEYAKKVKKELLSRGFRVELNDSNEKMGAKIRKFELNKLPMIMVIGDREVENNTVTLRVRGEGDWGAMTLEEYFERIKPLVEMGVPRYQGLDD